MRGEYRNHHYVPEWYQKRFSLPIPENKQGLYYLDLDPKKFKDSRGRIFIDKEIKQPGFRRCFAEENLYTLRFDKTESINIEKYFFGSIDQKGLPAVDYFANFDYPWDGEHLVNELLIYMGAQKLRTPKGLGWLAEKMRNQNQNKVLSNMMRLRNLYGALWMECVWLIADASQTETKFIISDHPVTIYNRRCPPGKHWTRGFNDPGIEFNASHTIFPLSIDKVLILTNLSWVRNPYQSETKPRPNPRPFRDAIFKVTETQVRRHLSEQEVNEINYIIKKRALKYVAAAKKEWLYPEKVLPSLEWHKFGNGYLCMPDPRGVHLGGEIFWGGNGYGGAMDEYGRIPGDPEYGREGKTLKEGYTLENFKGEFARLYGPKRRGRGATVFEIDEEQDSDKLHQYYLDQEKKKPKTYI